MNELIILGALQLMVWTSIIIYRMLKKYMKNMTQETIQEELPPYEVPPPRYTEVVQITSNELVVLR